MRDGNLIGLHMRISGQSILAYAGSGEPAERHGPGRVPGPHAERRRKAISAITIPNLLIDHAMRNTAHAAGLLARRQHQPQRHLCRMLHGRAGACRRPGPARVPAQAAGEQPKHLAVLNAVAEKAGWGKPAPAGVYRGLAQFMGYGSYVAACAEVSVSDDGVLKIHRIVAATDPRPRGQSGADRAAGRGLVRLRPVGAALRRVHGQGRPHRAGELRHLQRHAHATRCRRSRRS